MRKSGIYMIQNVKTGDAYIGSTRHLSHRKNQHFSELRRGIHLNKRIQKAFTEYGEKFFVFVIIEEVENKDLLVVREQYWLDQLKPKYNILLTANNNTITRTAALVEKYKKHSEVMRGRKASKETREKMSQAHFEHWSDPKNRDKLKKTPEQREHFRQLATGERNPWFGKKRPKETCKKISDGNSKIRVGFISPEGIEYKVEHLSNFCREQNLHYFSMRHVAIGKRKSHKGWTRVPGSLSKSS